MGSVDPTISSAPPDLDGKTSVSTDGQKPVRSSPRPTFERATAIPYTSAARFLWGDEESGRVSDWIYASTDKIHMIVYGLAPGGRCLHSDAFRTVFGADVTYYVLEGKLVLANPETGEVRVAEPGELILFRRDTWHHIFSESTDRLRVLEFFAPPPSTGTSRKYAQTRPYLETSRYADDTQLGTWPPPDLPPSLHLRRPADYLWRRDGDALLGIVASTEHLTVAEATLLPGKRSEMHQHRGDECLYVTEGVLHVEAVDGDGSSWLELDPGDGFYCPQGTSHRYCNIGSAPAKAVLGVAPQWSP